MRYEVTTRYARATVVLTEKGTENNAQLENTQMDYFSSQTCWRSERWLNSRSVEPGCWWWVCWCHLCKWRHWMQKDDALLVFFFFGHGEENKKTKTSDTRERVSLCSLFILQRWQESSFSRGFPKLHSLSWCCPIRMLMLSVFCFFFHWLVSTRQGQKNSLALDRTLFSLMTIKMAGLKTCFKREPSEVKATGQYNRGKQI